MNFLNPETIIPAIGILGICLIIFAETGLLLGFFLPGDALLFASGIFAHDGHYNILLLITLTSVSAIVGDSVGYFSGKIINERILRKKTGLLGITEDKIERTERFYKRFGALTIVIARFIPVIRTIAPFLAGVSRMNYKKFFFYNISGGILWVVSMTLLGYYLGSRIPNIDKFVFPFLIGIVVVSGVPAIIRIIRNKRRKNRKE